MAGENLMRRRRPSTLNFNLPGKTRKQSVQFYQNLFQMNNPQTQKTIHNSFNLAQIQYMSQAVPYF